MATVTEDETRARLAALVGKYPTKGEAATALGISPTTLSDMLHGRKLITGQPLQALGLVRVQIIRDRETTDAQD